MSKNLCPRCETENEESYEYCKNCGTPLVHNYANRQDSSYDTSSQNNYSYSYAHSAFVMDSIGGIPSDEVALFVNKNSSNILAKFSKMELTNSKASWCWPVAILGFLLGPIGIAFWFFYRKMYKNAAILTAVSLIINLIVSLLSASLPAVNLEMAMMQLLNNDVAGALQTIGTKTLVITLLIDAISVISTLTFTIVFAILALNLYKRHCVKTILNHKASIQDERYYKYSLSSLGGVSAGMVILGIVIYYVSNFLINFVISFASFTTQF